MSKADDDMDAIVERLRVVLGCMEDGSYTAREAGNELSAIAEDLFDLEDES